MERCLIDTTVFDRTINQKQKELLFKLISKYRLVVPVNVLEEIFFRIIVVTIGSEIKSNKYFDIKEAWEKCKATKILELIDKGYLEVADARYEDMKTAKEIEIKYKLLSNDALIAVISLNRKIKRIATFDEDFKRVDFLKIVKV